MRLFKNPQNGVKLKWLSLGSQTLFANLLCLQPQATGIWYRRRGKDRNMFKAKMYVVTR